MSSFITDLFRVAFSKGLMIILGLSTAVLTARTLGPEANGVIASLAVYPSIFMSIGSLGIRQSTTYFLGKQIFTENQIKTAITQIWFLSSFISIIVCFILIYYVSENGNNLMYVFLAILPIPFSLFNTYNSGIFLGKNNIKTFNRINWIPTLVILLLASLFIIVLKMDIEGYMLAMVGGPVFMFFILLFKNKFIQSFSLVYEWEIIKKMLGLGLIYALSLLVISLNYKIDIILMDKLSTPYEIGIYSKGAAIIQQLWQIPMLLSTIVFARSSTSKNDHAFSIKVTQLLRISLVIIGIASIIVVLLSKYIIIGLYGINFKNSISVLKILVPGVLLLTFFKVINMDLAGKGKPWIAMKAMIPSLIVNLALNFYLIPKYGADGAAWASTISYSVAALSFLYFYSKETKISIREILTYKKSDFKPLLGVLNKLKPIFKIK
jgi:O-antigen/teichoic acid export membrane protein